ncbi:lysozyme [Massilia sp. DJPM01]|uniref:lysozyme n=1 Tax=Massilia sp. DJPM01 TaxID=3024404 RepID=UPI00259E767A|nr:lysozyme [Massilia sp. DJPM01]MDM5178502.1 lysozyme [Massilia sp. DJPM01]
MNKARFNIAAVVISAMAFVGIASREGYTDNAVIPTKGDVPTHGFGTTEGVKMGDRTNPVKALQRAMADVQKYEGAIKKCVTVPVSQGEYDAYVDLAYNVGPTNFCYQRDKQGRIIGPSTLVKRLNSQDYTGACNAILAYKYAAGYDCSTPGNKRCAGLWTDRQRVHAQCLAAQ